MKKQYVDKFTRDSRDREMTRLYVDEGLTLEQIAKRFGMYRQNVHYRLKKLGVERRPAAHVAGSSRLQAVKLSIEVASLVRKYVVNGKTLIELHRQTGIGRKMLRKILVSEGVDIRPHLGIPHPEMAKLGLMESIVLDLPRKKKPHDHCYQTAAKYGIKVSVRKIMKGVYRVTRIR